MLHKLKEFFGIGVDRQVRELLDHSNMRVGFFVTPLSFATQVYFIIKMIMDSFAPGATSEDIANVENRIIVYSLIALVCAGFFVVSFLYITGRYRNHYLSAFATGLYVIFAAIYAIYIGRVDFEQGLELLIFPTVIFFMVAIFVMHPLFAIPFLAISFYIFFYLLYNIRPLQGENYFNYMVTLGVAIAVALIHYNERRFQAKSQVAIGKVAYLDRLTGLPNMNGFRREAEGALRTNRFKNKPYGYIYIDILNFKGYNEKYGFEAGNTVLRQLSDILGTIFGADAVICRYSGNHFVVMTDMENTEHKIRKVRSLLQEKHKGEHLEIRAGIYIAKKNDDNVLFAADKAKTALDLMTKNHENIFNYFDLKLSNRFKLQQYIVDELDMALARNYVQVYYQPVVRTMTGEVCGAEALARWNDPEYGFLSPADFIEVLEQNRLIYKLDTYIIEQICKDMDHLRRMGQEDCIVPVSFNLSRVDFELMDTVAVLEEMCSRYDIPKDMIHVELTESALIGNKDFLQTEIQRLHRHGFEVWMDDFGSGYSSLNVLQDFDFDVLKIDMVFLKNYDTNPRSRKILTSVIDMARKLEIQTLAEGVETAEHNEFLKNLGCEKVQGYYFERPKSLSDCIDLVKARQIKIESSIHCNLS